MEGGNVKGEDRMLAQWVQEQMEEAAKFREQEVEKDE